MRSSFSIPLQVNSDKGLAEVIVANIFEGSDAQRVDVVHAAVVSSL